MSWAEVSKKPQKCKPQVTEGNKPAPRLRFLSLDGCGERTC